MIRFFTIITLSAISVSCKPDSKAVNDVPENLFQEFIVKEVKLLEKPFTGQLITISKYNRDTENKEEVITLNLVCPPDAGGHSPIQSSYLAISDDNNVNSRRGGWALKSKLPNNSIITSFRSDKDIIDA